MSYQTGQAFRRALETRLLNQSIQGAVSLVRLRKDLVDILLVAAYSPVAAPGLRAAIQATFTAQGSDPPPTSLPAPPAAWTAKYRKLAQESGLMAATLTEAVAQARAFLDPVLSGQTDGTWAPERQVWL